VHCICICISNCDVRLCYFIQWFVVIILALCIPILVPCSVLLTPSNRAISVARALPLPEALAGLLDLLPLCLAWYTHTKAFAMMCDKMTQYAVILYQSFAHVASVRLLSAEADDEEAVARVPELVRHVGRVVVDLADDLRVLVPFADLLNSLALSFEKVQIELLELVFCFVVLIWVWGCFVLFCSVLFVC
jgi:hypothetical protein